MAAARESAMGAYQAFLDDEPSFGGMLSRPITVPSLPGVPAPPRPPEPPRYPEPPRHREPPRHPERQRYPDPRRHPEPPRPPERPRRPDLSRQPERPRHPEAPRPPEPWSPRQGLRPIVLLACCVAVVLTVIVGIARIHHVDPALGDLKVSMEPQQSCGHDVRLHTTFRLGEPTTVAFWLQRDDVRVGLGSKPLSDGDQTVDLDLPGPLASEGSVRIIAATPDGTTADAITDVTCSRD